MEAQEEMRSPSTHANKSEACNNMIANNKTSPDIYCANVSSKQPRKSKGVRPRKNTAELTVGRGIELRQIPDYLKLALVGRFCGKFPGREAMQIWINEKWEGELGYKPEFHVLPKGWFLLKPRQENDGHKLLDRNWH